MESILKRYLRTETKEPYGILVATKDGVGWSVCSKKDHYDKELGLKIAISRASYNRSKPLEIPKEIREEVERMEGRRKSYFRLS